MLSRIFCITVDSIPVCLLACLQVVQNIMNMSGFLVHGPPVRLFMSLVCVLSLWNTGGSRTECSKFGYSLCFRDWQQTTFQARILNKFDRSGNNKSPISGFFLWLLGFESHLCYRIICTSTVTTLVQTIVFSFLDLLVSSLLLLLCLHDPSSAHQPEWSFCKSHYITFQVLPSRLPTSKQLFKEALLVLGSYPKSFTRSTWPCPPCPCWFLHPLISFILLSHHC